MERTTVYCQRSLAGVTPEQLLAGCQEADLHTIAESYDIPDDVIVDALGQLRIENVDPQRFRCYRLCYRPDGMRQIDIERWQTSEEVRDVIAEVLEELEESRSGILPLSDAPQRQDAASEAGRLCHFKAAGCRFYFDPSAIHSRPRHPRNPRLKIR